MRGRRAGADATWLRRSWAWAPRVHQDGERHRRPWLIAAGSSVGTLVLAAVVNAAVPDVLEGLAGGIQGAVGQPVEVRARAAALDIGEDYSFASSQVLDASTAAERANRVFSDPSSALSFPADKGVVKANELPIFLTLTGTGKAEIVVTGIRARVLRETPAANGTLRRQTTEGLIQNPRLVIDLGSRDRTARVEEPGDPGVPLFRKFTAITLKSGEKETFNVLAYAREPRGYEFDLEVVLDDGRVLRAQSPGEQRLAVSGYATS